MSNDIGQRVGCALFEAAIPAAILPDRRTVALGVGYPQRMTAMGIAMLAAVPITGRMPKRRREPRGKSDRPS
jgi:hypothetical protein